MKKRFEPPLQSISPSRQRSGCKTDVFCVFSKRSKASFAALEADDFRISRKPDTGHPSGLRSRHSADAPLYVAASVTTAHGSLSPASADELRLWSCGDRPGDRVPGLHGLFVAA